MAERSKAPDLSSGTRMCAWVRTPLLTSFCQIYNSKPVKFMQNFIPQRGFEPRTFGLGIQRAIHCATRAVWEYGDIKIPITRIGSILTQPSKICHPGNPICMFQWRNRLARGTYTVVHVRNAEVVSSSLTWNSGFWSKQFYFINRCYPSPTNYCAIDPAPLTPIRFK